jgi:hypothetical protein
MHPIYTKGNFGIHGIACRYYNGSTTTTGYITKQIGTNTFQVTDGTNPKTVSLAQNPAQVALLGSTAPNLFTIFVSPATPGASGGTFTATYGLDASTSIASGGAGYSTSDAISVTGAVRAGASITVVSNPIANATVTVAGTVVTFVASGASGNQVNLGGTATLTQTALYTFLTGSADANVAKFNYYQSGTSIFLYSKTAGTTNNAQTMASSSGALTVSGNTAGGTANVDTSGGAAATVTQSGGVATGVTVTTAGTFVSAAPTPIFGYYTGNGRAPVSLNAGYKLVSIASSGGSGYSVGQALTFVGLTATQNPIAHISTSSSGAATAVTVDTAGTGITTAATLIGVLGTPEHVRGLYDAVLQTTEGHKYSWTLGTSVNNSAVIPKYS